MADEQEVQHSETPAVEEPKNDVPEEVKIAPPDDGKEHEQENEKAKDKLSEFGETDVEKFIAKMTSDSVYARTILRKMLGLDEDKPLLLNKTAGSPQENNITGDLVHTVYPPVVKNVNTDVKPTEKEANEAGTVDKVE